MELRITTQIEPGVLPEIEWNNEELKQEIAQKAAEYQSIAYTEGQTAEMKKDRATLNKLVTAFESERKRIKKFYLAPYEKFDGQVKELLSPVREAIGVIDHGLDEIDQKYRADRTEKMRGFYEKHAGDLKELIPFERTVKEELYKKAFTDKRLEQHFIDYFARATCDLEALDELPEQFRDRAKLEYLRDFSIANALREGRRLEAQEKMLQDLKKKQEEAASPAPPAAGSLPAGEPVQSPAAAALPDENSADASVQSTTAEMAEQPQAAQAAEICLDFRVWGTREQLMGLREYMKDNHIRFGKVE